MNFFKTFLAALLAILVVGVLLLVITIGAIASAVSGADKEVAVANNSVLKINLATQIVENYPATDEPDFSGLFGEFSPIQGATPKMGLHQIIQKIDEAAEDDRIRGIYINPALTFSAGQATLGAIHDALTRFKESGKFIIAYAEVFTEPAYYLASTADKIYLPPGGLMEFNGFVSTPTFFKGMFDKVGIEPVVFKVGSFKSAAEPYVQKELSPENREQITEYINTLWYEYREDIAEARGMTVQQLDEIANAYVLGMAEGALESGLIDGVWYEDQVLDELRNRLEIEKDDKIKFVTLKKYLRTPALNAPDGDGRIAVVFVDGQIMQGKSTDGTAGSTTIIKSLRKAREDKKVGAIVLRVNSPGGSALASDNIAREVELAREAKPVIVSMGNLAASGGYYISAPADYIFAEENTLTGSIGVVGIFYNVNELMNDKLGLTFDEVETNEHANYLNPTIPLSPVEIAMQQRLTERIYGDFIEIVREGRSEFYPDSASVDAIAQGRVWTGKRAKELNLIDAHGGLYDAIAYAAEQANLTDDYRLKLLPRVKTPFEQIIEGMTEATIQQHNPLREELRALLELKKRIPESGTYALMPFDLSVE